MSVSNTTAEGVMANVTSFSLLTNVINLSFFPLLKSHINYIVDFFVLFLLLGQMGKQK